MAADIGTIRAAINADTKGWVSGFGSATKVLTTFAVAVPAVLTTIATTVAIKTTKIYADFQQNMANVSTMIRTNSEQLTNQLGDSVLDLTKVIPQASAVMTSALYDILSASVPVAHSIDMLGKSGKAAVAGVSDVKTAAKLATGTINALGLEFTDVDKVFDIAFSTVASGVVTFGELAGTLGQVLPAAKKMNASMEELYGSIAFLTKNTLSADIAGISYARALDGLAAKADILEGMGVKVFGTEGQYIGILKVVEQIAEQIKGLTDQAKVRIFEEMGFDIRAARAIVIMSENVEAFRQTLDEVSDSAGKMETAYDKMKNTLVNQWKLLKNSFSVLWVEIGEGFGGIATEGIKKIRELVNGVSEIIAGAGGLGPLWINHKELVISTFNDIFAAGLTMTGSLMSSIATIIYEGSKVIWTPLASGLATAIQCMTGAAVWEIANLFEKMPGVAKGSMDGFKRFVEKDFYDWQVEQEKETTEKNKANIENFTQAVITAYKSSTATVSAETKNALAALSTLSEGVKTDTVTAQEAATTTTETESAKRVATMAKEVETIAMAARDSATLASMAQDDYSKFFMEGNLARWKFLKEGIDKEQGWYQELYDSTLIDTKLSAEKGVYWRQWESDKKKKITDGELTDIGPGGFLEKEQLAGIDRVAKGREAANRRIVQAEELHWQDMVNITGTGVNAITDSYYGMTDVLSDLPGIQKVSHDTWLSQLDDWVTKSVRLINDLTSAWKSISIIVSKIAGWLGGDGGGAGAGIANLAGLATGGGGGAGGLAAGVGGAAGGVGFLSKVGGGIKAGAGAVAKGAGAVGSAIAPFLPLAAAGGIAYKAFGPMLETLTGWDLPWTGTGGDKEREKERAQAWESQGFSKQEDWLADKRANQAAQQIANMEKATSAFGVLTASREIDAQSVARYSDNMAALNALQLSGNEYAQAQIEWLEKTGQGFENLSGSLYRASDAQDKFVKKLGRTTGVLTNITGAAFGLSDELAGHSLTTAFAETANEANRASTSYSKAGRAADITSSDIRKAISTMAESRMMGTWVSPDSRSSTSTPPLSSNSSQQSQIADNSEIINLLSQVAENTSGPGGTLERNQVGQAIVDLILPALRSGGYI